MGPLLVPLRDAGAVTVQLSQFILSFQQERNVLLSDLFFSQKCITADKMYLKETDVEIFGFLFSQSSSK